MEYLKVGQKPETKYCVGQTVYLKDYSYSLFLTKDGFKSNEKLDHNQPYKILTLNCLLPSDSKEKTNDTILSGLDGRILFTQEKFLSFNTTNHRTLNHHDYHNDYGIPMWKCGIHNTVTS